MRRLDNRRFWTEAELDFFICAAIATGYWFGRNEPAPRMIPWVGALVLFGCSLVTFTIARVVRRRFSPSRGGAR